MVRGVVGVLLLLGVSAVHVSAQSFGPEVRRVEFLGNETFPRDSLARAIITTQSECRSFLLQWIIPVCPVFGWGQRQSALRERDVPLDVQRLQRWYQMRGFREVDVASDTELDDDGRALVRFTITEGSPILADSINYEVPGGFDAGTLLDGLPIGAGDRWSTLALDQTRDTLVRRLRNRGYPYADVLRQTVLPQGQPYHAHVTFEIEPGVPARYGDIRVQGTQHLDESTVLRTLPFRSGDPYRVDQLLDGQARLFGLDIIRNARVEPDTSAMRSQSTPDSIVPLFVQVSEGDPYRIRAGAGFNSAECFNSEARWTSRNFLGGGRVVQVRGRLANMLAPCGPQSGQDRFARLTWVSAVDFSQPWIFSTRNSFNASLFAERQSVPDIFIRRAVGLQLALVRAVGPRTPLTLSYRPELSTLVAAEVLLCTGFLVCTERDLGTLTGTRRLAPVGVNLTRDLANSLLNPTAGYRLTFDLEHAAPWTGSEFRYNRALVEGTWYSRLTGASVLATRLRGGWVGWGEFDVNDVQTAIVHPQKRFYAGGANSVRGFGQSRLGPRVLAVDNPASLLSEFRQTPGAACLPADLVAATCDAQGLRNIFVSRPIGGTRVIEGNIEVRFAVGRDFEIVSFGDFGQVWGADQDFRPAELEFTPGIGVRYLSPVGPIRVDLGYSFRGSEQLSVVTQQIAPFAGDCTVQPSPCVNVRGADGTSTLIPYVQTGQLALLPDVLFGENESRFQLHLSIGQAF
ncbi:MAG: BamA/TamA family outer membrane protein [Gemmatimonadota bacterium]|nr:BamA/TamA family outer membrane protein [Gemmatimonadota bacterium]